MRALILSMVLFLISTLSFATEKNMSDIQTKVKLTTTLGDIIIQLNTEKAPVSSANFLTYVNEGFYNGTIFHRLKAISLYFYGTQLMALTIKIYRA